MKDERKDKFVDALTNAKGIIYLACEAVGISRQTYYNWRKSDEVFREAVDEVLETQVDWVENKLLDLINAGDTTATIFYLKTKGKKRGYSDKAQPKDEDHKDPVVTDAIAMLPGPVPTPSEKDNKRIENRIKSKKNYIIKLLKKQGKYSAEITYQVEITAQLLVRTEILADEIFSEGHKVVNVEYSREGNERLSTNPQEKLYLDLLRQSQKALQALGMNTEGKERKSDEDSFTSLMSEFRDDS